MILQGLMWSFPSSIYKNGASTHLNEHSIALLVRPSRNEALILEKPKTLEVPLKKAPAWVFLKMITIFP